MFICLSSLIFCFLLVLKGSYLSCICSPSTAIQRVRSTHGTMIFHLNLEVERQPCMGGMLTTGEKEKAVEWTGSVPDCTEEPPKGYSSCSVSWMDVYASYISLWLQKAQTTKCAECISLTKPVTHFLSSHAYLLNSLKLFYMNINVYNLPWT
jgi:hypothetical protein